MIPSFHTDMSEQTVQTPISLILEEHLANQGLHCLLLWLHLSETSIIVEGFCSGIIKVALKLAIIILNGSKIV